MGELGAAFHIRGDFVAVALGHVDVGQNDVRRIGIEPIDRQLPISDRRHFNVFVGKRELDDTLNRDAVVG